MTGIHQCRLAGFSAHPVSEERRADSILFEDYIDILTTAGWEHTHTTYAPLSADRFSAGMVAAMLKKRILGITSRYVIIVKQ